MIPPKLQLALDSGVLNTVSGADTRCLKVNHAASQGVVMVVQPIGFIESCFKDKFAVPRQPGLVPEATARLKIRPEYHPRQSLQGLEGFSHIWLIWVFHESRTSRYHAKVHPPRLEGKSLGVFATRSPHRPNPLGLSLVELERIEGDTLWLRGVDLMDGTPILDIKPYLPEVESHPQAQAGWVGEEAARPRLTVIFSETATAELNEWQATWPAVRLRRLIEDSIALDPRPEIYRGDDGTEGEGWLRRPNHAFRLHDGDVHFRMVGPFVAEVFKILILNDEIRPMNLHKLTGLVKPKPKSEGV